MLDPVRPVRAFSWLLLLAACASFSLLSGCRKLLPGSSADYNPASQAVVQTQLRAIQSAQNAFMTSREHYACTMGELGSQFGLIDHQLAYGHKDGYNYSIECSANLNPSYQVWATPAETGLMSPSSYCIDQTGQMRRSSHRLDTCSEGHPVE